MASAGEPGLCGSAGLCAFPLRPVKGKSLAAVPVAVVVLLVALPGAAVVGTTRTRRPAREPA